MFCIPVWGSKEFPLAWCLRKTEKMSFYVSINTLGYAEHAVSSLRPLETAKLVLSLHHRKSARSETQCSTAGKLAFLSHKSRNFYALQLQPGYRTSNVQLLLIFILKSGAVSSVGRCNFRNCCYRTRNYARTTATKATAHTNLAQVATWATDTMQQWSVANLLARKARTRPLTMVNARVSAKAKSKQFAEHIHTQACVAHTYTKERASSGTERARERERRSKKGSPMVAVTMSL